MTGQVLVEQTGRRVCVQVSWEQHAWTWEGAGLGRARSCGARAALPVVPHRAMGTVLYAVHLPVTGCRLPPENGVPFRQEHSEGRGLTTELSVASTPAAGSLKQTGHQLPSHHGLKAAAGRPSPACFWVLHLVCLPHHPTPPWCCQLRVRDSLQCLSPSVPRSLSRNTGS